MKNTILKLILITSLVGACAQKKQETDSVIDPMTAAIETATSTISGIPDEIDGASFARMTPVNWKKDLLISEAFAASCTRPVYNSCLSGVKSETYVNCTPGLTSFSINGIVSLNYSLSNCALSSVGSSVTRNYNVSISGPHGGELSISSATRSDYNGNSYGGGGRLTVTNSGWNIEVLGKHKTLSFKNRSLYDVSIRTLTPIQVTGSLSRAGRVVNSGQLQINHNIAEFTAVMSASNLQWSNSCCHPTAGSLSLNLSGSKTGSATVTFQGCGQAEVNENGQTRNIELSYCE